MASDLVNSWRYTLKTLEHKWFVFLAGIKLGVPLWRLIVHDLSKFSRHELKYYGRQFCQRITDIIVMPKDGYDEAWLHHQNVNDHHWEYWIPRTDIGDGTFDNRPLRMPRAAMLELCADWMGASRAYNKQWPDSNWPFIKKQWPKIKNRIHPETQKDIITEFLNLGIKIPYKEEDYA